VKKDPSHIIPPKSHSNCCSAGYSFSYLIKISVGEEKYYILFDAGISEETVANALKLESDVSSISHIILSHRHFDHCGGLVPMLNFIHNERKKRGKENEAPVTVHAHPLVFCEYGFRTRDGLIFQSESCAGANLIEANGGKVETSSQPKLTVGDTVLLSGEIPRVSGYEPGIPSSIRKVENEWISDVHLMEEQFLLLSLRKGLVVISACSHAGIVNVVTHACNKLMPGVPLCLVMGGFHLSGKIYEAITDRTIQDLLSFKPNFVCAGHCTGFKAKAELRNKLGDSFHTTPAGCTFVFE